MPGPSLGINLSPVVDWSTAYPFLDHFKMSRTWLTQRDGVWSTNQENLLDLDSEGWVRDFTKDGSPAPFQRVNTIVNTGSENLRDGNWIIDWQGEGRIEVSNARIVSRSGNQIVLDPGNGAVEISIHSTDPNNNGNYLRDIRFYHQNDKALIDAGAIFNPAFLEKIEDFRVLRFMDWMQTNNSTDRTWGDAPAIGAAQQTAGVSVDVMVALANKVGADPWFTIPHGADAEYIRQFATYVRDHLDPNLVARFEYSNEVWNWSFEQAQWADQQARNAWGQTEGGWMQWYGVKSAEMANIVADVFGSQTGTRALNVFSTQAGWEGLEQYALDAPAHVARGGAAPKDAPFHIYSIAPYFGGSIGDSSMQDQINSWASQGEAGFRAALDYLSRNIDSDVARMVAYHAGQARAQGWQIEAYEAGQHIVDHAGLFGGAEDPAITRFYTELVARPEMADLYQRYFETWRDNGGGMMAHYSDITTPGRYGSWGLWESAYSEDTPRARAVEAFRDGVAAWWNDDRPASVFEGDYSSTNPGTGTPAPQPTPPAPRPSDPSPQPTQPAPQPSQPAPAPEPVQPAPQPTQPKPQPTQPAPQPSQPAPPPAPTNPQPSDPSTLKGTSGDDVLVVTLATTKVDAGTGFDIVQSSVSWVMPVGVEVLQLTGPDAINGTGTDGNDKIVGNAAGNTLQGNGGNDHLDGAAGNDILKGGAGDDTLLGGDGDDTLDGGTGTGRLEGGKGDDTYILSGDSRSTIVEADSGGTDQVRSSVTTTLASNVENLVLTGSDAINGTGNASANRITGNEAANIISGGRGTDMLLGGGGADTLSGGSSKDLLEGGAGIDVLTGGTGNDVFRFTNRAEAGDIVTDFRNWYGNNDVFHISAAGFGGGLTAGVISSSQFRTRGDNLAQDADDRFIFRTTDKTLWFDSNGNADGGLTLVADLDSGAKLTSADILVY